MNHEGITQIFAPWASSRSFEIVVPFDRVSGRVYLNAIGANRAEAERPFACGAVEMSAEEIENLDFTTSRLQIAAGDDLDPRFFPVSVPMHRVSALPVLAAIGSNDTEATVNLDFLNEDAADYYFASAGIEMTQLLELQATQLKIGV